MIAPAPASPPFRLFSLRFLAILLCMMGTAHILSTLASMRDVSRSAHNRLAPALAANTMTLLPPVTPAAQLLPFTTADARYSVCRFDAAKGPVSVSVDLLDLGWTLAVYKTDGSSVYAAAAPPGRVTHIALTIVPGDDRFMGLTPEARGKINTLDAPLSVTAREGLVVVRAPDKGLAYAAEAEAGLARSSCAPKAF